MNPNLQLHSYIKDSFTIIIKLNYKRTFINKYNIDVL
jgi:hypothetical protein